MYTNQDAAPSITRANHACSHAAGEATPETCAYLRVLREFRAWIDRAEAAHRSTENTARAQLGELWTLQARLSYALDHCPNVRASRQTDSAVVGIWRGYGNDGQP